VRPESEKLRLELGQLVDDVWDAAIGGAPEEEKARFREQADALAARLFMAGRRAERPTLEGMERSIRDCMARGDDARSTAGVLLNLYEYTDGRSHPPQQPGRLPW
jgi:hypothetical protein